METKELKIGNYIDKTEKSNEDFNDYYIVKNIDYAEHRNKETSIIGCKGNKNGYFSFLISKCKPIPLTDELIKANNWEFGTCGDLSFSNGYNPNEYNIYKDYECLTSVQFLHEYQNLYYAIYKKELILSNNS